MFKRPIVSILAGVLLAPSIMGATALADDLSPTTSETVYFRGWQYRTDVVQENIQRYNETQEGNVDYATVTGDYPTLMETMLIAGDSLDIIYANPSSAVRYYEGGWLLPAAELSNAAEIEADMFPNIRDAWTHKGNLLGLSYFVTTRGVIHVNTEKYAAAGKSEADYPKSWDDLIDQVFELSEAGVETPFLPHWFNEFHGISWGFQFEVMNRGGQVADPQTHAPALSATEGAGFETLSDWKRLWNAKIVPEEVLTMNESAYLKAFSSGRYVFSPQQAYDLATFNDPEHSQIAGKVSFLPYDGQSWGMIDSAMYVMTKRDRSDGLTEDVKRMLSWYGYEDHEGEVAVGSRWLRESMLFSAYKSVMNSPEAEEKIKSALMNPDNHQKLLDVYAASPYPKGVWNVAWSEEFNSWLRDHLQNFLLKDRPVTDTIEEINEKIVSLNRKYGI